MTSRTIRGVLVHGVFKPSHDCRFPPLSQFIPLFGFLPMPHTILYVCLFFKPPVPKEGTASYWSRLSASTSIQHCQSWTQLFHRAMPGCFSAYILHHGPLQKFKISIYKVLYKIFDLRFVSFVFFASF